MRALLYKDFLVAKKYLRMIFLMDAIFIGVSFVSMDVPFMMIFPLITGAAAISSLISHDERAHFDRSCDMMPVSRRTQVSEKYLIGLLQAGVVGLLCTGCILLHYPAGSVERRAMLLLLPVLGLVPSALMLPFVFRLGSERGRLFYLGFYFAGLAAAMLGTDAAAEGNTRLIGTPFPAVLLLSLLIYALSWRLSVRFFEKREL